jgi:hypothetical protein
MGHEGRADDVLEKSAKACDQDRVSTREHRLSAQGDCSQAQQDRGVSAPLRVGSSLTADRDEAQWSKLQNLGMTLADEAKLVAMRDYILKLANNASRCVPNSVCANTHPSLSQLCFPHTVGTRLRQDRPHDGGRRAPETLRRPSDRLSQITRHHRPLACLPPLERHVGSIRHPTDESGCQRRHARARRAAATTRGDQ